MNIYARRTAYMTFDSLLLEVKDNC